MFQPLSYRNLPGRPVPHQNGTMRAPPKSVTAAVLCGLALCASRAQQAPRPTGTSNPAPQGAAPNQPRKTIRTLTPDDGMGVISAALDPKVRQFASHDCSHLVHAIYERAGFPYTYADSDDLYDGVEGFLRVQYPQPGDLIVWRGHTGIVVRPSRHVFFSFMSAGPGIDNYESPYWVARGEHRFYRYIKKHPCSGCTSVRAALPRPREDK